MTKKKQFFKETTWLFIIGCFIGFILETLWYFFKHGIFINKQGVLYGPFKPIYGLGILLLSFLIPKKEKKKTLTIFVLGILIGSIYEYSVSIFQEYVLKTSTWNYSSFRFNLNGRIYLPYCIMWGIATVLWIKIFYPRIKKWILKIPIWLTMVAAIFMISDLILSSFAVIAYAKRSNHISHNSKILSIMDKVYDDTVMKKKFPKWKVIKKD